MINYIIIDTDIIINIGRKDKTAIERIRKEENSSILSISAVTEMELIIGCRNKSEQKLLEKFLINFEIVNINYEITVKAIELLKRYRLSHGLLIADSLIAATSIITDRPILTKNQKDYKFIEDLKLISYP